VKCTQNGYHSALFAVYSGPPNGSVQAMKWPWDGCQACLQLKRWGAKHGCFLRHFRLSNDGSTADFPRNKQKSAAAYLMYTPGDFVPKK